ncbi:MAG: ATP-dependent RNA helicase HrpA [Deltaproteobacteria bacterium]|nr:ATP-dependent RNA helicase HrpA [Deltaproteobacteria bacterium]
MSDFKDKFFQKKQPMPRRHRPKRPINPPNITYLSALPITRKKDEIIDAIKKNQVVVITGETGSGKTTQIPKMCLEAGRGQKGLIGCTQPRRVAAVMIAHRIAEELGETVGNTVGYKIRFEDRGGRNQCIKIMTDGILLMEAQADPLLRAYDTIIVDEAHERSLNIDFILGILKKILHRRPELKVIITSATIDTEKFSQAFDHAPIVEVSGRTYPVEVHYAPITANTEDEEDASYVEGAVNAVIKLRDEGHRQDILVFMPAERDIREFCDLMEGKQFSDCKALPMFARLPREEQLRVFQPANVQKIIVATNIAETSVTIPGIHFVIDTGYARISQYNSRTRTTSLPIKSISQSSADQRKGRCGRMANGVCIRLYDERAFEQMPLYTEPEILRSNLAEVILRMLFLNLSDISTFPFIDRPNPRNIKDAIDLLIELGAVQVKPKADKINVKQLMLTQKGRLMAGMPLDPRISCVIIEAKKEGCLQEVKIIAAALSIQDPRERPLENETTADRIHKTFKDPASDFVTLLNIWNHYQKIRKESNSRNQLRKFCKEHFLSFKRMREWEDVHDQIGQIVEEQNDIIRPDVPADKEMLPKYDAVHKSILSGFLSNIAVKKEKNIYTATKGRQAMIFPGSGLFGKGADWIVAAEMVETSRLFARTAANIDSDWLEALGGPLCRSTYSEPHWEKNRGEVVAYEQVTLFGLVIVPRRAVSYGPIDPGEASKIFIRSALVDGNVKIPLPFLAHNQALIKRISDMEEKIRRRDLLVGEEIMAQFYESKIPGVYDIRTLQKLIKDQGGDGFLRMTEKEILLNAPDPETIALFPDEVKLGNVALPCSYRFSPSTPDDGATIKIPVQLMPMIPLDAIDWAVPGLLRGKITALVKGLPKEYRKKLQPIDQTCSTLYETLAPQIQPLPSVQENDKSPELTKALSDKGPLINELAKLIRERFGITISATAWHDDALENHIKTRVAIVDANGNELASTRDIAQLRNGFIADVESKWFSKACGQWEKEDLTDWNFGKLPEVIYLGKNGEAVQGCAFPALEARGESVNIRLYKTRTEAETAHRKGVVALYKIYFKDNLKYLKKSLAFTGEMKIWAPHLSGIKSLEKSLAEKVMTDLFSQNIRSRETFLKLAEQMGPQMLTKGQEVLQEIRPILQAYYETITVIKNLEKSHGSNSPALDYLAGLKEELHYLLPHHFLSLYNSERLSHLPRYLKAIGIRAERGLLHLEKAYAKEKEIRAVTQEYQHILSELPPSISADKKRAMDDFLWMVEEYKVSIFAQELKTAFPVSRKRLDQKLRTIEEMT